MTDIFVDCPNGLAGDMLLAALLDLGVPREVVDAPLAAIGLENSYELKVKEDRSFGLRGTRVLVSALEEDPPSRHWREIRELINRTSLIDDSLKKSVLAVFKALAEAEAFVHGEEIEQVHFHELGAIDSLVDVVGVCAAFNYLRPSRIVCGIPPAGRGTVKTSHGVLPLPVPAVVEMAKTHRVSLMGCEALPPGELTTPTGFALMAVNSSSFGQPSSLSIRRVGIGFGQRNIDRANLLRVFEIESLDDVPTGQVSNDLNLQHLIIQESWIDDASPEDVAGLVEQLRSAGALDVACSQVIMKKGRSGVSLTALVEIDKVRQLRKIWLSYGSTLGLRERKEDRWSLPRRLGYCSTRVGEIAVKQVLRPDGRFTYKPEYEDILRVSKESGKTVEELRREVFLALEDFVPKEDWSW